MENKTFKKHNLFLIYSDKDGNIYSAKTGKKRKLWKTKHGYLQLAISTPKRTSYLAHRLIADMWIPNPHKKPNINHKNGKKDDNRPENLEWVTQLENMRHARDVLKIRFSVSGLQHPSAKFKKSHQIILKNLYKEGFPMSKIAKIMGFARPTILRHFKSITKSKK